MKLAFIGVGRMGAGMARNLLRAGHELTVYNRTREKAEPLARDGAIVAESPAAAVRDCDAVHTMLSDDRAVEEVVDAFWAALPPHAVHLSHSTIGTALAKRLAARGRYLSAPVFGRPEAAETKRLVVVVAGSPELIQRYRPLFDAIGRSTFVAGPDSWQANAVKLCGNFMIASMLETFAEANALMRKAGVDPNLFLDTVNSLFASPVYANYGRIVADDRFEPAGFALKLGLKDSRLMLATAEACESPMPIASLVHDRLLAALARGQGEMDWSSVARVSAAEAGL